MSSRNEAIQRAETYFDSGAFLTDLARLIAIPTESQEPYQKHQLMRYLKEEMRPLLERLGFKTHIFDNPNPIGGPFLFGERIEDPSFPTVLTYGHGDVVRGQAGSWMGGRDPFVLEEDGERIYGRGTADNKCQHLINLQALGCLLQEKKQLGFNCKVIIETSEETGSAGLQEFFDEHKKMLAADVLIASDGPRLQWDTPTVFTGARGAQTFTLQVNLRDGANHSGNWGGLLADPAIILANAISCIADKRGQIQIPSWRPTSLTSDIREALRDLPVGDSQGPAINENWGEESLTPAERVFGWNSFAVLAMKSGVPEAPVNAIDGYAFAVCQLRYVVGTDVQGLLPSLRAHLDANGFDNVEIRQEDRGFFHATRLSPDNAWVRMVMASLEETSGKTPHLLPNLAGSLPNECFAETLGLPTVWVPHSYAGCSQHAPNEHILKPVARDAMRNMVALFWDISEKGAPI
ncbi:M20 family metallopeptidase [Pseudovibrio ascidiaceicola]|uniref:M20 family metallopeptidase n=1 Tax=Pseudovibrio ascidiaceicola TaxID=285279 RepID=UPI003D36B39A